MIAIVDYKAGNLASVERALRHLGHECRITADPDAIAAADRVIFPGVGAAGTAMRQLASTGLDQALRRVAAAGRPFLGICLGYQVLFDFSDEDATPCLGILRGRVVKFADNLVPEAGGRPLKVPQMGWNSVRFTRPHPVWQGVAADSQFYFVHSYHPVPEATDVCALTEYGAEFASGAARGNLAAFQFHPEKSGRVGLRLLDNFCRWKP